MNCEHRNLTSAKMLRARRGREGKEQKKHQIGRERGTLFPAAPKLQGVGEESNRICRSCSWRHSSLVKSLTKAPPHTHLHTFPALENKPFHHAVATGEELRQRMGQPTLLGNGREHKEVLSAYHRKVFLIVYF